MDMNRIKYPFFKALFFLVVFIGIMVLYFTKIGCVWNYFLGFPCPGCGITRALLALLRGDILLSLKHHFMLFSVPILFLYIIFDGNLFKNRIVNYTVIYVIVLGFFVRWILWFI